MALRVAVPERIRAVAVSCVAVGIFLLDGSAAHGWVAWLGIALFSAGVALYDGLSEGLVGPRQAGMVLVLMGLAGATWSVLAITLTVVFLEASVPSILYAALILSLVSLAGGVGLRRGAGRWPTATLARARNGRQAAAARRHAA